MEEKINTFDNKLTYKQVVTNFLNSERQKLVKSNISLGYLVALKAEMDERGADENAQEEKVGNDRNQLVTVSERINDFREDIKNIKGVIGRLEELLAIEDDDKLFEELTKGAEAEPVKLDPEDLKEDDKGDSDEAPAGEKA